MDFIYSYATNFFKRLISSVLMDAPINSSENTGHFSESDLLVPPGRTGHVAVAFDKYMFVWGGYRQHLPSDDGPEVLASTYFDGEELWIHSSVTGRWYYKECTGVDRPPGMSGSAAVIINSALYLFGGYNYSGEGCTNRLFKLDLDTFAWESLSPTGSPPSPVDKMVGWQYNNKFYIFGGFGNPDSSQAYEFEFVFYNMLWRGWTNQFFMYDPAKNHWSKPECSGTFPSARAAHAAAVMKDKVFIFGGRHDTQRLNDLHCLDLQTMTWSGEIPISGPLPEGRSWHSLTTVSNKFLILYGGFSQDNVALSDCWMFDTEKELWQLVELPFNKPRLWHSACLNLHNEVLIYGGCTSNILDLDRKPDQAEDIIAVRITPMSLFRISIEKVSGLQKLRPFWSSLPRHIQLLLHTKVGSSLTANIEGS